MYYGHQNKSDNERYLQDELDQARQQLERQREEEREAREERLREMRERGERNLRSANDWPESLSKQAYLFQREQDSYNNEIEDTYFGDGAAACRRGLEIWREVEASKQAEIEALEKQIEAIRESIKAEVSQKLEAEANGRAGWKSVAGAIVTEDPSAWLDW